MTAKAHDSPIDIDPGSIAEYVLMDDAWFVLDMPHKACGIDEYYPLLVANGTMAGCARYCLLSSGAVRFRADIPRQFGLESDILDGPQVCPSESTVSELSGLLGSLLSGPEIVASLNVAQLCTASGWPCTQRSNGRVAVELEARSAAPSAIVTSVSNGLEISLDLLTLDKGEPVSPRCLEALALLLLRVAGSVRMVRPVSRQFEDRTVLQLSVHVPPTNSALHMSHAFPALSVAAEQCRAECRALVQPALAGLYLMTV